MDQNPKDKMPHFLLKTHNCTDAEERKVMYEQFKWKDLGVLVQDVFIYKFST